MFKGKQIKFLEQESTKQGVKLDDHDKELKNVSTKLQDLEKLMESTKESLNQLSASRFDSISKEIQEFNEKVENSMNSLVKLQQDMGELSAVNQTLTELKSSITKLQSNIDTNKKNLDVTKSDYTALKSSIDMLNNNNDDNKSAIMELRLDVKSSKSAVDSVSSNIQTFKAELKGDMAQLVTDFNDTKDVVQRVKNELQEERQKVIDGQETIMKQEVTISEKSSQLEKLEKELKESRALIGRLEAQKDSLERELKEMKENRDKQYRDLTKVQEDFSTYKKTNEGQFSFNAAVKRFLEQSTEGKILLELFKKSPQTMDALAEKLGVAMVILKTSVNQLQDYSVVKLDSEARTVTL